MRGRRANPGTGCGCRCQGIGGSGPARAERGRTATATLFGEPFPTGVSGACRPPRAVCGVLNAELSAHADWRVQFDAVPVAPLLVAFERHKGAAVDLDRVVGPRAVQLVPVSGARGCARLVREGVRDGGSTTGS